MTDEERQAITARLLERLHSLAGELARSPSADAVVAAPDHDPFDSQGEALWD
jgi:hypothetical protein